MPGNCQSVYFSCFNNRVATESCVVWHSTGPEQAQAPQWDYTTFLNMEYNSLNKILVVRDWNMIQES